MYLMGMVNVIGHIPAPWKSWKSWNMWDILVKLHITIEQMGTSPFSLGRSTISAMFNSDVVVYQRASGDDKYLEITNMAISAEWIRECLWMDLVW